MRKFKRFGLTLAILLVPSLACRGLSTTPVPPTSAPVTAPAGTRPSPTPILTDQAATPPECLDYSSNLDLTASSTSPQVGETLVLTATLANTGTCGMLGLPQYTLKFKADTAVPILEPNPPAPVVHSLGIQPGQSDTISYTLQVTGSGVITITVSASFEVHLGYPGPAYWAGDSSAPLVIRVP